MSQIRVRPIDRAEPTLPATAESTVGGGAVIKYDPNAVTLGQRFKDALVVADQRIQHALVDEYPLLRGVLFAAVLAVLALCVWVFVIKPNWTTTTSARRR